MWLNLIKPQKADISIGPYLPIGDYQQDMILSAALLNSCHGHLDNGCERCGSCSKNRNRKAMSKLEIN